VVKFFVKWDGGMRMLGTVKGIIILRIFDIILGYGCALSPT
jgi:hypothetical protein